MELEIGKVYIVRDLLNEETHIVRARYSEPYEIRVSYITNKCYRIERGMTQYWAVKKEWFEKVEILDELV